MKENPFFGGDVNRDDNLLFQGNEALTKAEDISLQVTLNKPHFKINRFTSSHESLIIMILVDDENNSD